MIDQTDSDAEQRGVWTRRRLTLAEPLMMPKLERRESTTGKRKKMRKTSDESPWRTAPAREQRKERGERERRGIPTRRRQGMGDEAAVSRLEDVKVE
jgi:hypothetical protein